MDNYICVYDFETDDSDPTTCEPVQLAACMMHPITLDIVENSEFCSYMRPADIDEEDYFTKHEGTIIWHAKNYNPEFKQFNDQQQKDAAKKIFDTWKAAPEQKQVWKDFATYLLKYNKNQSNRGRFTAPIRAGANILRFDNVIVNRMCTRFGYTTKDGEQKIFHPRDNIDILHLAFYWFESLPQPKSYNMEELRNFFQMSSEGAHDALIDVRDEAAIIQKFMRLHRRTAAKVTFRGAMAPKPVA